MIVACCSSMLLPALAHARSLSGRSVPRDGGGGGGAGGGGEKAGGGGRMGSMESGDLGGGMGGSSSDMEVRYRSLYEQQTNPFTQFSQMEKQRKYAELSVAEKITLNTTRMFLSSKFARNFVFFYIVTLHLLVFVTVFHWSHSGECPACACASGSGSSDSAGSALVELHKHAPPEAAGGHRVGHMVGHDPTGSG